MDRMLSSRFIEVAVGAFAVAIGIVAAVVVAAIFLIGLAVAVDLVAGAVH